MQSSFYSMQQQWHDLSLVSPTSWWKFVNNGALRVKTHTGYLKLVHWGLGSWKAFLDCLKLVHTDARHRCPQLGTLHEWTKVWHGHAGVDTCSSLWLLVPPRYTEQVDQVEVSLHWSRPIYACAPLIDGLGHATLSATVPVCRCRTQSFQQNRHFNFLAHVPQAVLIAHKPPHSL